MVVEATGRRHEASARLLRAAGIAVAVVNPGRVRHFARAKGRLAKTDALDAVIRPLPGQPRDAATEQLAAPVQRRRQRVDLQVVEKNRRHSQRYRKRPKTMAACLTPNTVAPWLSLFGRARSGFR